MGPATFSDWAERYPDIAQMYKVLDDGSFSYKPPEPYQPPEPPKPKTQWPVTGFAMQPERKTANYPFAKRTRIHQPRI